MQALRWFPSGKQCRIDPAEGEEAAAAGHEDGNRIAILEEENARLRRAVEELEDAKKSLLERTLRLERLLAEQEQQQPRNQRGTLETATTTTIMLPPHLFMKAYALMRGSSKPLVLRVTAKEAVDIDRMKV